MKQTDLGLDLSTRRTRKQVLLDEMERVMPWNELLAIISRMRRWPQPAVRRLSWR